MNLFRILSTRVVINNLLMYNSQWFPCLGFALIYCHIIPFKGTSPGGSDMLATTDVTESLLSSGLVCSDGLSLQHNTTYYSTLHITNGAITKLTTTLSTNGIF